GEAWGGRAPGRIADLALLEPRLRRDGVIVVVDAAQVRERAANRHTGDTIARPLAGAHLLVLHKVDLAADLAALQRWLSTQTSVPALEANFADVPIDLLFGLERQGAGHE